MTEVCVLPPMRAFWPTKAVAFLIAAFACCATSAEVDESRGSCAEQVLPGINFAGGEFNAGIIPGTYGRDYIFPAAQEFAFARRMNVKMIRVPFLWERLQPTLGGELDTQEAERITNIVRMSEKAGLIVVLDAHNYASYRGVSLAGRPDLVAGLANFWSRVASKFRTNRNVVFGIMNEPHDIGIREWADAARLVLAAIRSSGAANVVVVPGTKWDGAHSWFDVSGGLSNASSLLPLAAHDSHVVFEVHQYFDDNFSGTSAKCVVPTQVPQYLARVGKWAKDNHVQVMLGEFGVSADAACVAALDESLKVLESDRSSWFGWAYWAAGAWWGSYPFNVQTGDTENAQAKVLRENAAALNQQACDKPANH